MHGFYIINATSVEIAKMFGGRSIQAPTPLLKRAAKEYLDKLEELQGQRSSEGEGE